jgi:hypothetical protein
MRHARSAIRIARRAVDEMSVDELVPCGISSLLALAYAQITDADGFEEVAHRVPEAIAATRAGFEALNTAFRFRAEGVTVS